MAFVAPLVPYLIAGGTVLSAVGTLQQGQEMRRQANFQADQAEIQAQEQTIASNIAATNAKQSEADAQQAWIDSMRQKNRVIGSQNTAAAKSGLQLTGSIYDVSNDTALTFQKAANAELASNLNTAGNFRSEAAAGMRSRSNLILTAGNYRTSGRASVASSYLTAGGTLLTGFGTAGYYGKTPHG